jgi:hypothetical protein
MVTAFIPSCRNRLVHLDRRQHDALAARQDFADLGEGAGRERILRPGNFMQHLRVELVAEAQRLARHHDRLRHQRALLCLQALQARVGRAGQP